MIAIIKSVNKIEIEGKDHWFCCIWIGEGAKRGIYSSGNFKSLTALAKHADKVIKQMKTA